MFLFKLAFWALVVVMLLPNDDLSGQRAGVQVQVQDISSFCSRHERLCISPGQALYMLRQKATYAVHVASDLAALAANEAQVGRTAVRAWRNENSDQAEFVDTLKPQDREPDWRTSQFPSAVN